MFYYEGNPKQNNMTPAELKDEVERVFAMVAVSDIKEHENYQFSIIMQGLYFVKEHGNEEEQQEYEKILDRLDEEIENHYLHLANHHGHCPECNLAILNKKTRQLDMLLLSSQVLDSHIASK